MIVRLETGIEQAPDTRGGAAGRRAPLSAIVLTLLSAPSCLAMGPEPETLLAVAAARGDEQALRGLLAGGAGPDEHDRKGNTALMYAARAGRAGAMEILLDAGADPDLMNPHADGWTAMIHALHAGRPEAVRLLLDRGADPNRALRNGLTPLIVAAWQDDVDSVRVLLAAGADPRAESPQGTNVLTGAVAGGNPSLMRLLLAAAPDLRWTNNAQGIGARVMAWLHGDEEVLEMVDEILARQRGESRSTNRRSGA